MLKEVNLMRQTMEIGVYSHFLPFLIPETPCGQLQPPFPNAQRPRECWELEILGIPRLRAELLACNLAGGVPNLGIFAVVRHLGPPIPISRTKNQLF